MLFGFVVRVHQLRHNLTNLFTYLKQPQPLTCGGAKYYDDKGTSEQRKECPQECKEKREIDGQKV